MNTDRRDQVGEKKERKAERLGREKAERSEEPYFKKGRRGRPAAQGESIE